MAIQVAAQQFAPLTASECAAWRSVAGEIDANAMILETAVDRLQSRGKSRRCQGFASGERHQMGESAASVIAHFARSLAALLLLAG